MAQLSGCKNMIKSSEAVRKKKKKEVLARDYC